MAPDGKPVEQETVRTTIVGGRPPGSGKPLGPIPRGIEVLVKKAAVDPEFKALLLEKRAEAAQAIGLVLDPAESMMLAAAPTAQLESVIAQTTVAPALRPAFLGRAAAVMLVALGVGVAVVTGEERPAATQTAPPSAKQPAEPPAKSASAAVSEAEAAGIQARITQEYLPAFTDLATRHAVTSKAVRISVALEAGGAVESLQVQNPAEAGPVGFREELAGQIMKWKFSDVRRACTLVMLLQTPKEVPGAVQPANPIGFIMEGLRPVPPPQPVVMQPARVAVFSEVVAVSKDDAAAMQARIVKEYQAAFVDLATKQGAAGKTARFSLSLDGTGGVESIQFLNPAQAGTPEFRSELTGQILKWQFPDVKTPGAATVSVETTVQQVPLPARIIAGVPAMEEPTETVAKPGRVTVVPGIVPTPPDKEAAPASAKQPGLSAADVFGLYPMYGMLLNLPGVPNIGPSGLTLEAGSTPPLPAAPQVAPIPPVPVNRHAMHFITISGNLVSSYSTPEPWPEALPPPANPPTHSLTLGEPAVSSTSIPKESMMLNGNDQTSAKKAAADPLAAPRTSPAVTYSADWPKPIILHAPLQDLELLKVQLQEQKESEADAQKRADEAKADEKKMAEAKAASGAVSDEEAAAIQDRITKEYLPALTDLSARHGVAAKAVRISVALGPAGTVQSLQVQNPSEAGPVAFREELAGQIMKWKFPDVGRASTMTVLLETPKELPAAEQPSDIPVAVHGLRVLRPPATVQPARVTVFPDVVAVTKDDAAAMQARIVKEYQAAFIDLATKQGAAGKTARFSLSLDGTGGVESVQFLNPPQAGTPEFRDALTGMALKWTFPDLSRPGAATVQIETTSEAVPDRPFIGGSAGSRASLPPPTPLVAKAGRVTVVPGVVAAPPVETPVPTPSAAGPPAAPAAVDPR